MLFLNCTYKRNNLPIQVQFHAYFNALFLPAAMRYHSRMREVRP